ncbi:DUF6928 family protein [Streptomyces sp. NPDC059753]|uniref:DUF6928 family protein n=1 Tax=Streptomyces sp. NPDC059753 TaxID=3346933 RepID=UPI003665F88C
MGSKAALVAFVEEGFERVFRGPLVIDHVKSKRLAETVLGGAARETGPIPLDLAVWPDVGVVSAASFPGYEIVCSRELARNQPSELTDWVSRVAEGRRTYAVFMHSAEDWGAVAAWSENCLVRSLSLNPNSGIIEDFGERLAFESPFWEGRNLAPAPVVYNLPFHPIDFGNEALREFFGFILEGREDESCIDPEEVEIPTFRLL